jgi:hypothetical protein
LLAQHHQTFGYVAHLTPGDAPDWLYPITAVRLKVEENQLVDVFGEIGFHIDGLKGA